MPQTQQAPDDWSKDNPNPNLSPSRNPDIKTDPNVHTGKKDTTGRVEHEMLSEGKPFSESGKDIGLINSPIVALHPTSGNKDQAPKKYDVFDKANRFLNHTGPRHDFSYPFVDMEIGQGFFVPVQPSSNIDKLIAHLHKAIYAFHQQTSVEEKDENGDDVMESVTTLPKKRTQDGVIQLDSVGNPIVGANHTNRPKLVHMAQFVIKSAVKDDELVEGGQKAESDGALVIRVA